MITILENIYEIVEFLNTVLLLIGVLRESTILCLIAYILFIIGIILKRFIIPRISEKGSK